MVVKLACRKAAISLKSYKSTENYIQWAIELKLTSIPDSKEEGIFHLVGPFNFESIGKCNQTRQKVNIDQWRILQNQFKHLVIFTFYIWF